MSRVVRWRRLLAGVRAGVRAHGRAFRRTTAATAVAAAGLAALTLGPAALAVAWHETTRARSAPAALSGIGAETSDGPATFVVHEVRCGSDPEGSTHGRRCEVLITVRNDGDEDLVVPGGMQMLHGPEGVRHLPVPDQGEPFGTLSPGGSTTATVEFDLPQHAPVTHVGVRAQPYSDGQEIPIGERPLPLLPSD
jgi:hypothetical protein